MHKYIALFFSVTFFLTACKGSHPEGIIDHNRMIRLLTEVHIVDGSLYSVSQSPDSLYKYGVGSYVALFKRFHTDTTQFKKSMAYYTTQPTELQEMYVQVQQILKQKTDSLNKVQQNMNQAQFKLNQAQQKNNNAVPKK
ncbi:MAG: hypothetical protein JWP44_1162 [Mucilaginibacter sp.]|nr:hypothetical protein [Mucilaginibacter sp.]